MPNFCRDSYARKRLKELYGSFEFHARGMMGKSYRCTVVVARMLRSALANESAQERAVTCGIVLDSGCLLWTGVEADSPVRSIFVDRRCPPLFCRHVIVNSANAECTSNFRLPNKSKRSERDGHVRAYMLAGHRNNRKGMGMYVLTCSWGLRGTSERSVVGGGARMCEPCTFLDSWVFCNIIMLTMPGLKSENCQEPGCCEL